MKLTPARQQCSIYWEMWSPTMCVVVLCRSGCRGSWRRRTRCWRRHQRSGAGWRNRGTDRVGRRDWWRPWCWRTESPEQRPYAWLVLLLSGVSEFDMLAASHSLNGRRWSGDGGQSAFSHWCRDCPTISATETSAREEKRNCHHLIDTHRLLYY